MQIITTILSKFLLQNLNGGEVFAIVILFVLTLKIMNDSKKTNKDIRELDKKHAKELVDQKKEILLEVDKKDARLENKLSDIKAHITTEITGLKSDLDGYVDKLWELKK